MSSSHPTLSADPLPRRTRRPLRTAYEDYTEIVTGGRKGFPRAVRIQEWVPGLTTPEGGVVVAALAMLPPPGSTDVIDQVVHVLATGSMLLIVGGGPAASVWLGYSLTVNPHS